MKQLLLILTFLLLTTSIFSQNYKQVKIFINDLEDIHSLELMGLEFDHPFINKDKSITVFLSDDDFNRLQLSSYNYEILIDDWFQYYDSLPVLTEAEKQNFILDSKVNYNVDEFGFGSMGGFYTWNEVILELDSMKMLYPNLVTTKQSLRNTIEGRPIYYVKISDNPDLTENEPRVLYTALHHAREPQSMMQMIYFMYYLLENYGTDPEATYLVDNRELYFIPVINPDGYEYNRTTNPSGGGMWRKNRRNNGSSYGVDLNRNYGPYTYWNAPNGGSSTTPSSDTYRGTAPFSEPETAAIRDFIAGKNIKNALNYHTYSNLLIYPYGALGHETPDSIIFREYAKDMTEFNGYTYGTDLQTVGYSTRGNSDDYMYDGDLLLNGGKIFAMTPEVGSTGFWPSQPEIFPLAIENLFPNIYYAWVAGAYVNLIDPGYNQQYFNPGDVVTMNSVFRNKGLSDGSNIEVELTSLSPYVMINNGSATFNSIPARDDATIATPFSFTILSTAPIDVEAKLLVTTTSDNIPMSFDTLSIILGTPVFVFKDSMENPLDNWTINITPSSSPHWEATTSTFYSSPTSYTDSKNGQYISNATVTMTLTNPLDLSSINNPRLSYWTKWDIEDNWDYGQVKISINNGSSWIPLQGQFTNPGTGSFQPPGQPVYDGVQSTWVKEDISLTGYTSSQVKIQFQLRTDGSVTRDGWYLDDIGIIYYGVVPVEFTSFNASIVDNKVQLNWVTASEMNNDGFEIERLNNGDWGKIGFVKGKGTTTEFTYYTFTDKTPAYGKSKYRLKQIDFDGSYSYSNGIDIIANIINEYSLDQNYPNPFNPSTIIHYAIPNEGKVTLRIFNLLGVEVAKLVDETQQAGKYQVEFQPGNLSSGVYFYTLKSGVFNQTRKMLFVK
jgi:murein tripeptide amidase MpaA